MAGKSRRAAASGGDRLKNEGDDVYHDCGVVSRELATDRWKRNTAN